MAASILLVGASLTSSERKSYSENTYGTSGKMLMTKCDFNKVVVSVMDVFWGTCFYVTF